MRQSVNQVPAHWSKDFVEHLRTVHFALIAVCLGLIVLSFFPSKTQIKTAAAQAEEILYAHNHWDSSLLSRAIDQNPQVKHYSGNFLPFQQGKYHVGQYADQSSVLTTSVTLAATSGSQMSKLRFIFGANHEWRVLETELPSPLGVPRSYRPSEKLTPPASIKDFRLMWNQSNSGFKVVIPWSIPSACRVESRHGASGASAALPKCSIATDRSDVSVTEMHFSGHAMFNPPNLPLTEETEESFGTFVVDPSSEHFSVEIPVRVIDTSVELNSLLVKQFPKWKDKGGLTFEDAFRELVAVDKPFENADLESARNILEAEADREGDVFEAVGMKVPADVAVRFGFLFVLALQLYMWIHLREFGSRLEREPGFEVAWIGVYKSAPAQTVFRFSILYLPWVTITVLGYNRIHNRSQNRLLWWLIVIAAVIATMRLSYLLYQVLPESISPQSESATDLSSMD
jgi:hypothetical protein